MKTDNTFESLLVNEQKELLRHAYALVGQREEAEELLQEVAFKSVRKKRINSALVLISVAGFIEL